MAVGRGWALGAGETVANAVETGVEFGIGWFCANTLHDENNNAITITQLNRKIRFLDMGISIKNRLGTPESYPMFNKRASKPGKPREVVGPG